MAKETINNFYPTYKLHECADKDHDTLSFIHFENGYAYASNAHVAVRAKIEYISTFNEDEVALLEGKSIGCREFKALLEYEDVRIEEHGFRVNDDRTPLFFGFNRQQEFKFPDAENIVEQTKAKLGTADGVNATGLNVAYLGKLSKAMGETTFRFDFNGNGAVLVRAAHNLDAAENITGIIMPILVEDE